MRSVSPNLFCLKKFYRTAIIFTINSCGLNDKVVFLLRKDLNRDDYERFYFKKKVLGL